MQKSKSSFRRNQERIVFGRKDRLQRMSFFTDTMQIDNNSISSKSAGLEHVSFLRFQAVVPRNSFLSKEEEANPAKTKTETKRRKRMESRVSFVNAQQLFRPRRNQSSSTSYVSKHVVLQHEMCFDRYPNKSDDTFRFRS